MAKKPKGPVCPTHGVDLTNFNCGNCLIEEERERKHAERERRAQQDADAKRTSKRS